MISPEVMEVVNAPCQVEPWLECRACHCHWSGSAGVSWQLTCEDRVGMMTVLAPLSNVKPVLLISHKIYKIDQIPDCTSYWVQYEGILGHSLYLYLEVCGTWEGKVVPVWLEAPSFLKRCQWSQSLLLWKCYYAQIAFITINAQFNGEALQENYFSSEGWP